MPLPKPKKNEQKQKFVSRCIAEMTDEESKRFPSSKQRAAICYSQWGETPAEKAAAQRKAGSRKPAKRAKPSKSSK